MDKIVLFGASGFALEHYAYFKYDSPYDVVAFTVDSAYIKQKSIYNLPVVPFESVESIYPPEEYKMFISIGYLRLNKLRAERYYQAKNKGYHLVNYISSKAMVWPGLVIGDNCLISPLSFISPSANIGNDIYIGPGTGVGHDSKIEDHNFIGGGVSISGLVTVDSYCFIGTGAIIRDMIHIGGSSVIGAGAIILENTTEKSVHMGKPADVLPITSDKLPLFRQP